MSFCLDLPRDLVPGRLSCVNHAWRSTSLGVPGGSLASTCLGILFLGGYHVSTYLGIHKSRGPRRLTCLDLPGDLISRRLSRLDLPGDLHPDQGIPGSQVATVLGRVSFRKNPLRKTTHRNRRRPISCGTVPSLSNNSGAQQEPYYLSEKAKRGPSKVYQSALRLL